MPGLDETLSLAKRGKYTRAQLYGAMQALAEGYRGPGMSEAQAFAKFVGGEGAELMSLHQALCGAGSGGLVSDSAPSTSVSVAKSAPSGDWHDLVALCKRAHKQAHPYDTDAKANAAAVNAAMSTAGGMLLFKQQKRAEQIRTGQYTIADMACLDGIDAERQQQDDLHKRTSQQSEFEDMVADVMRKNPGLNRTRAGDAVRGTEAGMRAWLKDKGKPGENGVKPGHSADDGSRVPFVPTTSGRVDPPRVSQWESPHSGSHYTPPSGIPWDATNTPAIKAWMSLVARTELGGFSRERSVELLKLLPHGREALEKAAAEAASLL